jgi:hypothetical protein
MTLVFEAALDVKNSRPLVTEARQVSTRQALPVSCLHVKVETEACNGGAFYKITQAEEPRHKASYRYADTLVQSSLR